MGQGTRLDNNAGWRDNSVLTRGRERGAESATTPNLTLATYFPYPTPNEVVLNHKMSVSNMHVSFPTRSYHLGIFPAHHAKFILIFFVVLHSKTVEDSSRGLDIGLESAAQWRELFPLWKGIYMRMYALNYQYGRRIVTERSGKK